MGWEEGPRLPRFGVCFSQADQMLALLDRCDVCGADLCGDM